MESKKVKVYPIDRNFEVSKHRTFLWKLEGETPLKNGKIELIFTREENQNHLQEIKQIEKTVSDGFIPFFWCLVPVIGAFLLVTAYLIVFLAQRDTFDVFEGLLDYIVPAAGLMFLTVILTAVKLRKLEKFILNKDNLLKEAQNRVKNILENNGN